MSVTPVIRIDLGASSPAYRQIASALRTHLVAGVFTEGQQLPTIRQLAVDLSVHPNTVAEAYRVLAEEGWLTLRRRHGAIVRERSRPKAPREAHTSLLQRLQEIAAEAHAAGVGSHAIAKTMRAVARGLATGKLAKV